MTLQALDKEALAKQKEFYSFLILDWFMHKASPLHSDA